MVVKITPKLRQFWLNEIASTTAAALPTAMGSHTIEVVTVLLGTKQAIL